MSLRMRAYPTRIHNGSDLEYSNEISSIPIKRILLYTREPAVFVPLTSASACLARYRWVIGRLGLRAA